MNWQHDVKPAPAILVLPDAESLDEAHAAIELWEHYSRKRLDPTQRLAVEVMMAQSASGRWAASTTGREMPRQNGKGDEIEVVELWGLVQRSEAILHTIHDAVLLATQTQERMLGVLESHADLRRLILRRWKGTGQQMIEMRNGGIIWYRTRTGGGGRGVDDIDRLVVDEAQHATDEQLAAMTPTLLANEDPQMNVIGTAALEGKSSWWWKIRKRALSSDPGSFGYVGHTAERPVMGDDGRVISEPVDATDRSLWWDSNPALHAGRGRGAEFLEEQLRNLGPAMFAQEHLCVWAPEHGDHMAHPIPADVWASLIAEASVPTDNLQWAVAVSEDRRWASIGLAGRNSEGKLHVEWMHHRAGTAWVVDQIADGWSARRLPIRVHKSSPEGALIAPLRERGVEVVEVSTSEVAQATGQMIDAANSGELVHLGQPSLTKALMAAEVRTSVDGASVWSERRSSTEITPLKAVTVALGGVPAQKTDEWLGSFIDLNDLTLDELEEDEDAVSPR